MSSMIRCMGLVVALLLLATLSFAQTETERFTIDSFSVEGNTLLTPDEIDAAVTPFTGKQREYSDVQLAIEALRQRYRTRGFSVVWVVAPEQILDRGVVTLRVIEARIGTVTVEGNRFFNYSNVRSSLPALREGTSPRAGEISANAQLANENPAKQLDVVLRPGETQSVVNATVDVIDVRPLKAFLTVDNTGNPQTGNFRLGVGVQHANLFNRDHVGTFNYVTSPDKMDKVSLFSGSYRMPLYSWGDSMDFIAAYSDVSAGTAQTVAGPLTFSGKGSVYGVRYNQLLPRKGEYSHRIVYGLDYRAYENDCSLGNFGAAGCGPAAVDVTVMPVSAAYNGNWAKPGRISDFYVAVSHNIPGAANGEEKDFNAARPSPNGGDGASSHYTILRFGASMVNAFESNWQIRGAINAQYTPDALVSGEQFGITGATAVRGFLEREIVRDTGYHATLELYTPNMTGRLIPGKGNFRLLLFADIGKAGNNLLAGEDKQQASIASLGAGVRWNIQRNFNIRFDMARIMDEAGNRETGDMHGHVSAYLGF
ncbi:MAG: ShlB/FhaC/HecB family hemolysin secretion/activation protein [Geobacteraceae bacterium]|nr:ShlB/FhaC/HecB family hemolysin secretion/activation protein [Geobacteraceae bacterium]